MAVTALRTLLLWVVPSALLAGVSSAAAPEEASPVVTPADSPRHAYFTEVTLVDQDGREVLLYRDLIRGKVVVMNAFFTSCESICPMVSQVLTKVQTELGDALGRDVHMVSITLDPEVDRPQALAKYAKALGAKPGWRFVTGKKDDVQSALLELGYATPRRESHSGILLVINEPRGIWRKAFGLSSPKDILKILESVRNEPGTPH